MILHKIVDFTSRALWIQIALFKAHFAHAEQNAKLKSTVNHQNIARIGTQNSKVNKNTNFPGVMLVKKAECAQFLTRSASPLPKQTRQIYSYHSLDMESTLSFRHVTISLIRDFGLLSNHDNYLHIVSMNSVP